jgi:hypothetical protein
VTKGDQGAGESDRPAFAREMPRDPDVDALLAAFDAGDFARVRREAARLEASAADEAVKGAARAIAARTKADPLAVALVAITAALLVFLSLWWVMHDGPG